MRNSSLVNALSKPKQLAVSPDNRIFVIDGKRIIVFDQYGNNVAAYNNNIDFIGIRIIFNNLTLTAPDSIYYSDLRNPDFGLTRLNIEGIDGTTKMVNSLIFGHNLYILTQDRILVLKAE